MRLFEHSGPPKDASDIISTLFKDFNLDEAEEPSNNISPSGLLCQAACAFKLGGVPAEPQRSSFQSRSYADAGEDRHKRIQTFLSQTPYWVDVGDYVKSRGLPFDVTCQDGYETLLTGKEMPVRFRCDGLLLIEGVYYILEIKTERSSINNYRTTYEAKHQAQGVAYAALLDVGHILWLYEGRDTLEQKVFVQNVTEAEKQASLDNIQKIVDNKDRPEVLSRNKAACTYCLYRKHCKECFKGIKIGGES